jgi:hypothetical protein
MEKAVRKFKLHESPANDLEYWLKKSPLERLQALEELREQYVKMFLNGHQPGFQRVCRIIKQSKG